MAQLGARFHGMEEVVGSNPTCSTSFGGRGSGFDPRLLHHFERVVMRYLLALFLAVTAYASAQDFSNKTLVYPFYPRDIKGEVYKNLSQDILCGHGYTAKVRKVTGKMKKAIFKAYGIPKGHYGEYEVDHFISLELGGDNSLENLWPQPYEVYLNVHGKDLRMGAREKDVVETTLHKMICKGKITPEQADEIITTNWVGYYLKLKHKD